MDKQRAPHCLIASYFTEHPSTAPLPWPQVSVSLKPIRPPPLLYFNEIHENWTNRDDERLEADTWEYIQHEMNELEQERINPHRSFIHVAPEGLPWNGLGDYGSSRQEYWSAGQQVVPHWGAWQQGAWQQGAWQQGAWQQGPWQQQQLPAQQARGAASGATYGTVTPDAGYSPAEGSESKRAKRRSGAQQRRLKKQKQQ